MSTSESDTTGNGTDDQSGSDSSEFVESLQSGVSDGLLDSLGGGDGGFEAVGRELGEQVGRLLGELLGQKLDEQVQRMTESGSGGDDTSDAAASDDADGETPNVDSMSDDELQSAAEEISDELEERSDQ